MRVSELTKQKFTLLIKCLYLYAQLRKGDECFKKISPPSGPLNSNCGVAPVVTGSSPPGPDPSVSGHLSSLSPGAGASPSHCSMASGVGDSSEDVWRGSSIASLRRRAFEHSGISMSVFR